MQDEQRTKAPEAVRDVRWNGVQGRPQDSTTSREIIEKLPKHIVSTAQIVAELGGGGMAVPVTTGKAMNFGGGKRSESVGSRIAAQTGKSCKSGSLVTEELSEARAIAA